MTTNPTPELPVLLRQAREYIPAAAGEFLTRGLPPGPLAEAMRYAVMNGGKRVRPALVLGACQALGGAPENGLAAAVAVEMIHCYSLVHDDLPCMDDDDLRRGQPTTHKVYGEATALLAGDALQSLAFATLTSSPLSAAQIHAQVRVLSQASLEMAVGQTLDMAAEGQALGLEALENIHRGKTGALIRASVQLGVIAGGARVGDAHWSALTTYAERLGLAFQVHDDVLDVIGETQKIGKPAGSDAARDKSTYPALLGLEAAQALATRLHDEAVAALAALGEAAAPLRELADFLVARDH